MSILLVNPPLTQPSAPYPAIAYLAGYLRDLGYDVALADASLEVLLRVFSRDGIAELADAATAVAATDDVVRRFLDEAPRYAATVETAIRCLQGGDQGAVARATRPGYFPEPLSGPDAWATQAYYMVQGIDALVGGLSPAQRAHLASRANPARLAFGTSSEIDEARFRASTLIADLETIIRRVDEPGFALDTYAEHLTDDPEQYEALWARLSVAGTRLDRHIDRVADALMATHRPRVVGVSVPFPGCVYGALRIARRVKQVDPGVLVVMGGGWFNTQARDLAEPRVFDAVDCITLDDGERPLAAILEWRDGRRPIEHLCRTFVRLDGHVRFIDGAPDGQVSPAESGAPTYRGLSLQRYLAYRPTVQALQKFWGARWNALTMAHGCYWKKCAFCDTSLDYIGRYAPVPVDVLIDRVRRLVAETGQTGFHFVDEAMPPALMRAFAERVIRDGLDIAWWGNARFDRALIDMAPLLAASGCVAITGGLETASARTLAMIDKGVPIEQGARVCHALAGAGLFVHAYLIYGFPTETAQETVDALECVRQLFAAGAVHSAMWHQFSLTRHSPIARAPERFGITLRPSPPHPFSHYLLDFDEPGRIDHASFADGLRRATTEFRLGIGLDRPAHAWLAGATMPVPQTTLPPDFIAKALG